jgi:hypothetical protein
VKKNSSFGTTTLARLSSTPLLHKFETSKVSGSPLTGKRGSAIFTMFSFEICSLLDYTLHYEFENNNLTTNLLLLSVMISRKMVAKQIDFKDIFPQDISTCLVSMYKEMLHKKRT